MAHKVKLRKQDLNYFRRLALDSPLEIEVYCIGRAVSPDVTEIDEFIYPKEYKTQKTNTCEWSEKDVEYVEKRASDLGKRVIGSLHSHPSYVPIVSPTDYKEHIKIGHRVLGICGTTPKLRKTSVFFWIMDSALPCKIIYV